MKPITPLVVLIGLGISTPSAEAQQPGGFNPSALAREALSQPFVGITTDGRVREGLYRIEKTGQSTAAVREAAQAFLNALTDDQRVRTLFKIDDTEWRNWANIHRFPRQGVSLKEMTDEQRRTTHALLRASLSARGYETLRDIMRLNHHLGELVHNFDEYGEHLYWVTLMGTPSVTEPWGWQLDGHHLVVNFFVLGDQIVMTPTFMGSEPVEALSGAYKGASILQVEQDLGLKLMTSLPSEQQKLATGGPRHGQSAMIAQMFKDNVVLPYEGLNAAMMQPEHREALLQLMARYIGMMRDGHATAKLEEVRSHLDQTHFFWRGATSTDAVFYYRIYSPVILIEFDHQGPIALEGDRSVPTRRHVHTVVRTPNGNDYGRDLLRQHLNSSHHRGSK